MRKIAFVFALLASTAVSAQTITSAPQQSGSNLPGPKAAGRFYGPAINGTPNNTALPAANTLFAVPFFVASPSTAKTLSFNIGTGNASAWNARMCIYADNGSGAPGALVPNSDTGTIAIASGSVTGIQTATLSGNGAPLGGPAWYWLAFNADSASESVFQAAAFTNSSILTSTVVGAVSANSIFAAVVSAGAKVSQTFGACPATFGAATFGTGAPYIVVGF